MTNVANIQGSWAATIHLHSLGAPTTLWRDSLRINPPIGYCLVGIRGTGHDQGPFARFIVAIPCGGSPLDMDVAVLASAWLMSRTGAEGIPSQGGCSDALVRQYLI